jgi:uncharacterized repeat protein (TIGR02543 family)
MTNTDIVPFATIVVRTETELRNAVNAAAPGDVIQVVGTIVLAAQIVVPAGKDITIEGLGAGATLTRDLVSPSGTGRVITNDGILRMENIIITGGNSNASGAGIYNSTPASELTLGNGVVVTGNKLVSSYYYGGGIGNFRGTVTLRGNATVTNNESISPGATFSNSGGGIGNMYGSVFITEDASVTNNTVSGFSGGGIYNENGFITLSGNARITNNTSNNLGGGIFSYHTNLTITDNVLIADNYAADGGGIYLSELIYDMNITDNVSISNNTAENNGGGIAVFPIVNAGHLSTLTLSDNVSIVGNSALNGDGGGIFIPYSELDALYAGPNVVFANNVASQAYEIAPVDIPLYEAHIHSTVFTIPIYGYNNYDISYTRGTPRAVVTVGYDSNGGSAVDGQIVFSGDPTSEPPAPVRPGYVFAGWYIDPELTIPWNFGDPVTSDMTLYAKWEQELPEIFTVNFVSNGGTPVPPQDVNAGNALIPPVDPNRNCDIFDGWYTDPELTIPWNFGDPVTENMTLYAKWIPRDCPEPPNPPCPPYPPCPPEPPCGCAFYPPCVMLCRPQYCYPQNWCDCYGR